MGLFGSKDPAKLKEQAAKEIRRGNFAKGLRLDARADEIESREED